MNKLSKRLLTSSYGGARKITHQIQIAMLNKNLMSNFKYYIVLIALETRKIAEWILEWKDPVQCCAILGMALFDFEAEILAHNRDRLDPVSDKIRRGYRKVFMNGALYTEMI